jgi:hypothetical protein
MTIVVGQIEPLKKLKVILNKNGITRFNSIGEINAFTNNYGDEKKEIPKIIERKLNQEINNLQSILTKRQKFLDDLRTESLNELNHDIKKIEETLEQALERSKSNIFNKILYYLKIKKLRNKKSFLEKNKEKIISKKTHSTEQEVTKAQNKLDDHITNKDNIISRRCAESYREIDLTKEVVDGLYTLIAGAIGENSTVNELQKLSDNYFLINDFSAKFNPPIYNKIDKDRIFSVQIDHLLISQSGVFLLETKNWSKKSIKSLDLRSPVDQVLRTSYALFVLLNGQSNVHLTHHHWGSKKIPIRSIIVMTGEKPKEEFKHVKILSLNELVGYIKYFDEIFSPAEAKNIFNYLKNGFY